jgi:DNA-3-methyladenine glycosylase
VSSSARARTLPRTFYDRDARIVAPALLNKVLVGDDGDLAARLVEVEAYRGAQDPGSHAYRGATARNASMFARPGTLYVYFTYGMHWCANAVCGPGLQPHAVLLRAAVPVRGIDVMRSRRPGARRDLDLLRGPARLAQAFALDRDDNGSDLVRGGPLRIVDDGVPPPDAPVITTRIGLAAGKGDELLLRYAVADERHVSGPRTR